MQREYRIEDEGSEIQLQLMDKGVQVGGAVFPSDDSGEAFNHAIEVGEDWLTAHFRH